MNDLAWTRSPGGTWTLQDYDRELWEQTPIANRTSYRRLSQLPRFGLYLDERLIASVRAESAYVARDLFKHHGLKGDRIKRL